jgi:hypothetical protein
VIICHHIIYSHSHVITVVWKNAVDSLEEGLQYLHTSSEARIFVERYMKPVISILLEQIPHKIGMMERNCVEGSLKLSLQIIEEDLKVKTASTSASTEQSAVLEVLEMIFNKKKQYYKGTKLSGWNNNMNGLPEVRNSLVLRFRSHRSFGMLATYLDARAGRPEFPTLDIVRQILIATADVVPKKSKEYADKPSLRQNIENDLINVCKAIMKHLSTATEEYLKKQSNNNLNNLRYDLQNVFDPLFENRREETFLFYEFCRDFALKLISSQSLPLKLYGWDTISDLIEAAQNDYRPPAKQYVVSCAGTKFVNGVYNYAADLTTEGYVAPRSDIRYECDVPTNEKDKDGKRKTKRITLFRCTMRSQQKWWFLSEADEQQPGTDKDIDYYQHKSKKDEEDTPPTNGWTTCREGVDPPPQLRAKGIMVPSGEEYNTMEHQLAKWAINNKIVELVLGNSIHREIVARSIPLIKFLTEMCGKDNTVVEGQQNNENANAYCLEASHLTLAWNTCKSKLDPAVSAEVYHLLVSILPYLPDALSIHLLTTVQQSLGDGSESNQLFEVAEFCSTLAGGNPDSNADSGYMYFNDEVRAVVLKLLWGVLTHTEAHTLKCYQNLKLYVTHELRVEPMGTMQRESFLEFCKKDLRSNSTTNQTDEGAALRMVNLAQFVLEACPREQSALLVYANDGELAKLIFHELISYLNRRSASDTQIPLRKVIFLFWHLILLSIYIFYSDLISFKRFFQN